MKPMPVPRKSRLPEPTPANRAGADYVESFPPSVGTDCRILILGSMPGIRSLAAAQYYAHPQNLFWPMAQAVFGIGAAQPYATRMAALIERGVGLWDVLRGCERRGSLDSAIDVRTEVPNAIAALLQQRREIQILAFNGAKAAQAFQRHVSADIPTDRRRELELLVLPSTSPAHASMSREEKVRRWSVLAPMARPSRATPHTGDGLC